MNIGTILCSCRGEIDSHLNVDKLKEFCQKQPDVKVTRVYEASCSIHDQEDLIKAAQDIEIDGLLFIGCSPKYYEKAFQEIFYEKLNINPGLIKFANIREQVAWAHRNQSEEQINEKSKAFILAALEELRTAKTIKTESVPNLKSVLVIGAGISGIHATLALANQGFYTYLVEKEPYIGGPQLRFSKAFPRDECSACALTPIINTLSRTPNVEIFPLSEVVKVRGRTGNYIITIKHHPRFVKEICNNCGQCIDVCKTNVPDKYNYKLIDKKVIHLPNFDPFPRLPFISQSDIQYCRNECSQLCAKVCDLKAIDLNEEEKEFDINVGGIITAIGYNMYQPNEYGYGMSKDILSLEEYERMLVSNGPFNGKILKPSNKEPPESIAFILCVGSRQTGKIPYCSRYCCMATATAVKQTVEKLPDTKIYIFYRDIYAIGKMGEEYIKETENFKNVEWIRAIPEHFHKKPEKYKLESDEINLTITVAGGKLMIPFDMIVLATPMIPNKDTDKIRELLGLAKTPEGFFKESDMMLEPVSTYDVGKYLAGSCIGPRTINEAIVDGYAAAAGISRILSGNEITQFVTISDVDESICGGEGICVKTCFFHACSIDPEKKISVVDPTLCRGCGNCVAACPTGARDLLLFPSESIYRSIDILSEYQPPEGPKILGIMCNGCAYPAADQVGLTGKTFPPNISIIRVPCSGRIDPRFLLYAIEKGFDGIVLGACYPENCQYIGGNYDLEKRIDLLKELLKARGMEEKRLKILFISYLESEKFVKEIEDYVQMLNE
ncbi:MAG: hydrogenase iron-sulfur subunit [Candidatus Helarchaeota archaeon]|nr:hydrogenase iron-sulfur subunit [Candidatus Helarchaeota archaeon]